MWFRRKPKPWSWFAPDGLTATWEAVLTDAGGERSMDPMTWDVWLPSRGKGLEGRLDALVGGAPGAVIGAVPGAGALADKRLLWVRLVQALGRERAAELAPEVWLPDVARDRERLEGLAGPFMLKDARLQRRRGVSLVEHPLEELTEEAMKGRRLVVQRLVDDVLRVDGHRSSVRLWLVLQRDGGRLTAWRHREGLVVYSPDADGWITRATEDWLAPPGAPTRLSGLFERLGASGDGCMRAVDGALRAAVAAVRGDLAEAPTPGGRCCFELFGADFVFGADLRPWLLEINRKPRTPPREPAEEALRAEILRDALARGGVPGVGKGRSYVQVGSWGL